MSLTLRDDFVSPRVHAKRHQSVRQRTGLDTVARPHVRTRLRSLVQRGQYLGNDGRRYRCAVASGVTVLGRQEHSNCVPPSKSCDPKRVCRTTCLTIGARSFLNGYLAIEIICMPRISVIVCTHAPRPDYLERVLHALAAQDLPRDDWELLLVDNASPRPLAGTTDLSWHPCARIVREERLGLTPARLRGIVESSGDLLIFVDDDNVLASDYLSTAWRLLNMHPHLGVIGAGWIEPEFAIQPPREAVPYLALLALRKVARAVWGNDTESRSGVPWGPGLCVRRPVAETYPSFLMKLGTVDLIDRRGHQLFGNGDVAFSWSAVTCGQGFGVFPELRVIHLVPAERLTRSYFLRLAYDGTFSAGVLDYLWAGTWPIQGPAGMERWLRLSLRACRRGWFALRFRMALDRGLEHAASYIQEHNLQPISFTAKRR